MKIVIATICMIGTLLLATNRCLLHELKFVSFLCSLPNNIMAENNDLRAVEFEVFGKVQGVFFRKNTVIQGKKLGLRGWCMNTSKGSVLGKMEGELAKINEMKHWLRFVGSPASKIDEAVFRNETPIKKYSFNDFSVRN